ncbi:MAG: hypothetical protein M3R20_07165, partial [Pseudomonadota bacterium]|nr:hypothetical protein [Pseudomonadota bacterium]
MGGDSTVAFLFAMRPPLEFAMIAYRTQQSRLLSLLGLVIALGLPVLALIESHVWADLSARNAQSSLPLRHGWFWAGSSLRSEDHWRAWAT